ncbi:MAG TPA: phospholipase D-like domain-containing protein [Pseudonocardiaceae bacterium]|nr:phospholipase D-like domain-containing protein [Pseudonocardiaceae bacterium]
MNKASVVRRCLGGAGLGLAGMYAFHMARYRRAAGKGFDMPDPPAVGSSEFTAFVEALAQASSREGNRLEILRNGCEIFPAMLETINSARECIDFSTYIYWTGDIAPKFADALIAKASAGVEVNVVLDAQGSVKMDHGIIDRMRAAGATVVWFRPPHWYNVHKLNKRMHRRILIVDGKVGFMGGVGIAEEWDGNAEDQEHQRETHVRIAGPAVRDLMGGFLENWTEGTSALLSASHFPDIDAFNDGIPVQVARTVSTGGPRGLPEMLWAAVLGSKKRFWITTAFFAPRRAFVDALCDAARRGVDVRILTGGPHQDKQVAREAGHRSYARLLESGVRIFEYQQAKLHAKVITVDGIWGNVGSSNFENRSLSLNDEINITMQHAGVVGELEQHFYDDLTVSQELDLHSWSRRPLGKRAREYATDLIRQSL